MFIFDITDLNPAGAYVNAMDIAFKSDLEATRHETAEPVIKATKTGRTSTISTALTTLRHTLAHLFSSSRSKTA